MKLNYAMIAAAACLVTSLTECRSEGAAVLDVDAQIEVKKADMKKVLDQAKSENRSITAAETSTLDGIKAEIDKLVASKAATSREEVAGQVAAAIEARSTAAATVTATVKEPDANTFLRSVTRGAVNVGDVVFNDDVVRVFNETSPLFESSKVDTKQTGETYKFIKITGGNTGGGRKAEGIAGNNDTNTTVTPASVIFTTYSGESCLISTEMSDDAGFDVSAEVTGAGLAKCMYKFGGDAVATMASAFSTDNGTNGGTLTATSYAGNSSGSTVTYYPLLTNASTFAASDLVSLYYEVPARNRDGAKFICNATTAAKIVSIITNTNDPQITWIGFTKDSVVEEPAMPTDVVFFGNPAKVLAVGMKKPIRVFVQEVSAGKTIEPQPRIAVALRDSTAVSARYRKQS